MSECIYCGKKAGWFSNVHEACIEASKRGCEEVASMIASIVKDKLIPPTQLPDEEGYSKTFAEQVWTEVKPTLDQIATQYRIPSADMREALLRGWSAGAVDVATAKPMHPNRLAVSHNFFRALGFSDQELRRTDGLFAQGFSCLLWSVMVAGDPRAVANVQEHTFNLKAGEVALQYFGSVVYSRETVTRSRQGGYSGLSVPLGRGVYYHFGGFKAEALDVTTLKEIDYGAMLIATKHIYFGGPHTTFRVPYDNIVSFRSYASGLGIFRDNANSKAELFTVLERNPHGGEPINARPLVGWFLYNMAHFLSQPEARTLQPPQQSVT